MLIVHTYYSTYSDLVPFLLGEIWAKEKKLSEIKPPLKQYPIVSILSSKEKVLAMAKGELKSELPLEEVAVSLLDLDIHNK